MLQHIPFPALPAPPSWYPGHMTQFTRALPALLRRTDVVLELRDARLPLTSINRNFEGAPRFFVFIFLFLFILAGGCDAAGEGGKVVPEAGLGGLDDLVVGRADVEAEADLAGDRVGAARLEGEDPRGGERAELVGYGVGVYDHARGGEQGIGSGG